MARYHHLGFDLAKETRQIMMKMTRAGEINHLVSERVWLECEKALSEKNPECFFQTLRQIGALAILFPEINALFGVPSKPHYHPEIDSGIHTLYALQACCHMTPDPCLRFAALVHDLGKGATPMNAWPSHQDHDEAGLSLIKQLCQRLKVPNHYREFALLVCRFHLFIHRVERLPAEEILNVLNKADAFRRGHRFEQLLVVCEADIQGTGSRQPYPQAEQWRYILSECAKIGAEAVMAQGFKDKQIKEELDVRRCACIDLIQTMWKKNEKKQ